MPEEIFRWKKLPNTGPHGFQYKGRKRVLPGQVVECPISCIKPFISQYECLGSVTDDSIPDNDEKKQTTLEVVSRGKGYYNVINPDNPDNPINEKALRKAAAYKLAGLEPPKRSRKN